MTKTTPNDLTKRAVIYCRVSTKEQVEDGNSLVSQERICREYAIKEGYEISEVFVERGESAKTADRTELKRLMSFCTAKKGTVQAVIAYKVDRISRNIADYSYLRVRLKSAGVEIKSVTEYFEDTPAGRFMENIIANVGQFDNDVRTERSVGGMREATQEGRYVWMAPIGYDNVKVNGKSTIAQNAMAPLIKETFERIAQGTDAPEPVRLLMNAKGLATRSGKPMPRSNFYRLVRNRLYKGSIKMLGITIQGTFDPIVSEELFDDVQAILKGRNKKMKHYLHENPDFPLRRFVVNEHGKQLTGYWSKGKRLKYPYYSFQTRNTTIRKHVLEERFMSFLAKYEFDTKHLKTMRKYLHLHFENHAESSNKERKVAEERVVEINAQIDKLIDLETNGGISLKMLTERVKRLEEELDGLNQFTKQKQRKDFDIAKLLDFAASVLKEPQLLWEKSPFEIKKKLQVFDFPEGIIFDGQIFRTPKVCNVFKLKSDFGPTFGHLVHSKYTGKNTVAKPNTPPSDNFLKTKAFWGLVVEDLLELQKIMDPAPPAKEEKEPERWRW